MTSNAPGEIVFDALVVSVALSAVMPFVFLDLPGLLAFVAQFTATVACSAFVLRLMDIV